MDKHTPQRVERDNAKFEEWRKQNPTKQFKDYFAEGVKPMIARGKVHASLGGNLIEGNHGEVGQGFLRVLIARGLKPEDVCVDYGCGTLRLGVHVMKYLQPGAYWGMDVADFLLGGRTRSGRRRSTVREASELARHFRRGRCRSGGLQAGDAVLRQGALARAPRRSRRVSAQHHDNHRHRGPSSHPQQMERW